MSVQNDKTLEAYQKAAKNYLNSSKIVASAYKKNADKAKKELQRFIKDTFKDTPVGSKVLEVGSADGENAKYIQKLGYAVTASDIADDFLKAIRDNGLTPIRFNLLKDEFEDKYNAIFCWRVFVHFTKEDSINALNRSYDALENNGLLILSVINRDCKKVDNEWVDFPDEYHLGVDRYFNNYSKEQFYEIINNTEVEDYKGDSLVSYKDRLNKLVYSFKDGKLIKLEK